MIAEIVADLLARVQSVEALTNSASLSLGGHRIDPAMLKVTPPFAWIRYMGEESDEAPYGNSAQGGDAIVSASQKMLAVASVIIYVPYLDDNDLLTTQLPLLETVILTIHGKDCSAAGYRWRYIGQKLVLVGQGSGAGESDRLAYEQRYTLEMIPQSIAT